MANHVKGERSLTVNDKTYTVHFDFNALSELEDAMGMDTSEVMEELNKMKDEKRISIRFLRTLTWAGLLRHHDFTLQETGEWMSEASLIDVLNAVGEAFTTSLMTEEEFKQLEKKQKEATRAQVVKAQKKKSGTGKKSG